MSVRSALDLRMRYSGKVMVARPVGTLDVTTYPLLRDALLKCVAEQPDAVIVELDWLELAAPHAISVFPLVSMRASEWPGLPVMLAAEQMSQRGLVHARGVGRFVQVHESVPAAVAALEGPSPRQRAVLSVPHGVRCGSRTRRFVWDTCDRWGVEVVDDAMMIATELVENTMLHTTSDASVRLELRSTLLTVAVTDSDPRHPFLRERLAGGVRPCGLLLISAVAKAWGSAPTMQGGKTVWATLRVPGPALDR